MIELRPPLCCQHDLYPGCRRERELPIRRVARAAHRVAEPPYYHAPAAVCRLDGDPILRPDGTPNRQRRWHALCTVWWDISVHRDFTILAWRRIHSPAELRGQARSTGRFTQVRGLVPCAHCGRPLHPGEIEVDHIRELIDGGEHAFGNLQPLCHDGHVRKTTESLRRRLTDHRAARRAIEEALDPQMRLELPA